jgi:hypothetical protein
MAMEIDVSFFDAQKSVLLTRTIGTYFGEPSGVMVREWNRGGDTLEDGCHLESVDRPGENRVWVVRHRRA